MFRNVKKTSRDTVYIERTEWNFRRRRKSDVLTTQQITNAQHILQNNKICFESIFLASLGLGRWCVVYHPRSTAFSISCILIMMIVVIACVAWGLHRYNPCCCCWWWPPPLFVYSVVSHHHSILWYRQWKIVKLWHCLFFPYISIIPTRSCWSNTNMCQVST